MNDQALDSSEISAIPIRRTWYGVVGGQGSALTPQNLTESHDEAKARATVFNADYPRSGPWHVIVLTENLRAPV